MLIRSFGGLTSILEILSKLYVFYTYPSLSSPPLTIRLLGRCLAQALSTIATRARRLRGVSPHIPQIVDAKPVTPGSHAPPVARFACCVH